MDGKLGGDKDKSDEDESEYYYYYYDEDEEEPSTTLNSIGVNINKTPLDDLLDKSQTQRTTGLRAQEFASLTASSGGGQTEKGFTKRNLHTRHGVTTGSSNNIVTTVNSFNVSELSSNNKNPVNVKPTATKAKVEDTYRRRSSSNYERSFDSFGSSSRRSTQQTPKQPQQLKSSFDLDPKWSPRAVVPLSEKIRLRPDGSVQCLDKGIFPHPVSCRQFVHCAASEKNDGNIRSWVYACPKSLSFDAVGGMCNWTSDNACIE